MRNLEQGLNNNIALLEKTLSKKAILNIYGNLKVLEYRAITEKESDLLYRIQNIIVELEEFILRDECDYYMGKTYQYQGEIYPSFSNNLEDAKVYKSKKAAINSCNRLNEKISNGQIYKVFEIKE